MNERERQWADWLRAANAGDAAAYERLLRDIAEGRTVGDTTTLADPAVVKRLQTLYGDEE